jgi:hypothetical protein
MKIKKLSSLPLLTAIAIFSSTNPVHSESKLPSEQTFFCQTDEDTPTTVAKSSNGELQPIFHWKSTALPPNTNPEAICSRVSQQLENYLVSQNNLSTMGFKSTKLENIPIICATDKDNNCQTVLLSLNPVENPVQTANSVLNSTLDSQLQKNKITSRDRGVQSFAYQVNFWQLLGLNFIK